MGGVGFNVVEEQHTVLATPPFMLKEILLDASNTRHCKDPLKCQRAMSKINSQATLHAFTCCSEAVPCRPSPFLDSLELGFTTGLTPVAPLPPRRNSFAKNSNTHKLS